MDVIQARIKFGSHMFLAEDAFSAPKDPLYDIDIDPRSPIFRGDMHKWQNYPEGRSRSNDKFLQD